MRLSLPTLISRIFFLVGLGLTIWLVGGFFKFADEIVNSKTPNADIKADAIVSLTGGSRARLTEAIKLVENKNGQKLLISGVNKDTKPHELRALFGGSKEIYDCCINLGHEATDTIGNADEVREWVKTNDFKSIILITDNYHMPRSLLELKNANPQLIIKPYSVKSPPYDVKNWWENERTLKGLLNEYSKLKAAQLRLILNFDPKSYAR